MFGMKKLKERIAELERENAGFKETNGKLLKEIESAPKSARKIVVRMETGQFSCMGTHWQWFGSAYRVLKNSEVVADVFGVKAIYFSEK